MRLVGPNALIILVVYRCHGRHHIGVLAIQVKVFDLIFRCICRQLFGYFCICTAFVLAVNIVARNLRMTVFAVRLCPRKLQVKVAFAAGYCLVQIVDGSRRRGKIGNTVADKGGLVVRRTTQVALPLPQRPMESIGVYNRRGNSFRHKALLVQTGDGAARSHRSAFGGGISLAIAVFKACGDTVHCYILFAPFYGAVEEKPVGHFYAFCGGVFLRPCHLIQRSVIAQSKLRFADGGSLNIRAQRFPAIMVIAVGVALVAVHPVVSGIDLLQQVAGRFVFAIGHVPVILCGKLVVGIHRKLLIHRSLRNGSLHDSFIVPCAVRFLYVIFVDEHRCTADNNTVVGLCGKALTPLLVQRTLEGLRPVQCITCFNGCLSAEEAEFGAVAYTEGHAVRVPVRQLIAFRQDILCFVIARIHYLIKIGRRLQDRLDIRVRVGVGYTTVFGKDTVVVLVHGDNQKADRILGIGVHIAVRRNKAVISAGCSVLLYFAVYRCILIVYAPHIARQQVGLVVVCVLEGNCKHHLFPPGSVSVKVAHGNLDHRTVVVDLGLVIGQSVTVGQHRQIVHTVAVEVPHGHGDTQLAPLVSLRALHIIPGMVVIIAHQQTVTLAASGKAVTVIIPLLNLAASGIVGLRGIDHDAFLAITVKVTGHDIEEAAVGVGRNLKSAFIKHIAEVANLYQPAAV